MSAGALDPQLAAAAVVATVGVGAVAIALAMMRSRRLRNSNPSPREGARRVNRPRERSADDGAGGATIRSRDRLRGQGGGNPIPTPVERPIADPFEPPEPSPTPIPADLRPPASDEPAPVRAPTPVPADLRPPVSDDDSAPVRVPTPIPADLRPAVSDDDLAAVSVSEPPAEGVGGARIVTVLADLARREQALVTRQLRLVEELRRSEADPVRQERIRRLSQLVTKMGRNATGLLVLTGEHPPIDDAAAMSIGDIVDEALTGVSHGERVDRGALQPAQIDGWAAIGLRHLLAELLENAVSFSPPEAPVLVAGRAEDGSYVLTIEDRGIGMSETELAAANRDLAEPIGEPPDRARHLGFGVAAALAGRLGIGIELTSGDDRGLIATVCIPSAIVTPSPSPVRPASLDRLLAAPVPAPPVADGSSRTVADDPSFWTDPPVRPTPVTTGATTDDPWATVAQRAEPTTADEPWTTDDGPTTTTGDHPWATSQPSDAPTTGDHPWTTDDEPTTTTTTDDGPWTTDDEPTTTTDDPWTGETLGAEPVPVETPPGRNDPSDLVARLRGDVHSADVPGGLESLDPAIEREPGPIDPGGGGTPTAPGVDGPNDASPSPARRRPAASRRTPSTEPDPVPASVSEPLDVAPSIDSHQATIGAIGPIDRPLRPTGSRAFGLLALPSTPDDNPTRQPGPNDVIQLPDVRRRPSHRRSGSPPPTRGQKRAVAITSSHRALTVQASMVQERWSAFRDGQRAATGADPDTPAPEAGDPWTSTEHRAGPETADEPGEHRPWR